jgi:hypothetical protein
VQRGHRSKASKFGFAHGLALAGALWALSACSDGERFASGDAGECSGKEQCQCYGNGTCDLGLTCLSNYCVDVTSGDGAVALENDEDAQGDEKPSADESAADEPADDGNDDAENKPTDDSTPVDSDDALSSDGEVSDREPSSSDVSDSNSSDAGPSADDSSATDDSDDPMDTSEPSALDAGIDTESDVTLDDSDSDETSTQHEMDPSMSDAGSNPTTPSSALDAGAEGWRMSGGLLDGNDGWSASAESGVDFGAGCATLWGTGRVTVDWRGSVEHPMLLDPNKYYTLHVEGSAENIEKFVFQVQFAAIATPDSPQFLDPRTLQPGAFSIDETFAGLEQPGAVSFIMTVFDATEPFGRVCFDNAEVRLVQP